jgi:fibronectin-binding autotransporter adhesin
MIGFSTKAMAFGVPHGHAMSRLIPRFLLLLSLVAIGQPISQAATKRWDGGAGNSDWVSGQNWNPDNVPSISDDIILDSTFGNLPGSMFINGGFVGAQSVTFAAGFNPASTTLIGNGSGSASFLILGGPGTGSTPLIRVNSTSSTITFDRKNGGTADLNVELGATSSIEVNAGALLIINCDISGAYGLTKTGSGTLRLSGTNVYTGDTIVSQGTLAFTTAGLSSGSTYNSPVISVNSGAVLDVSGVAFALQGPQTLGGNGIINGHVTAAAGATVIVGPPGSAGTLTFNNNLTLNGAALMFDLANVHTEGSGVNDEIIIAGNLTLTGNNVIFLNYLNGSLPTGTYKIIKYNGTKTGTFVLGGSYQNVTLDETTTPNYVTLVVGGAGSSVLNLKWVGDGVNNVWDMGTAANWLNGASSSVYYERANVTFDGSGSATPAINLISTVIPSSVTVNSAGQYTISGSGKIGGIPGLTNRLTKAGSGTLSLNTDNDFIGGVDIQAGTLKVGNSGAIPSGPGKGDVSVAGTLDFNGNSITVNGLSGSGTLDNQSGGGDYTLTLGENSAGGTFSGLIKNTSGTLGLSKIGSGTITLSGNNTFSGPLTVSNGAVRVAHGNALGNTAGSTLIDGGPALGRLELTGGITVNEPLVLVMKYGVGSGTKDQQFAHIQNISGDNVLNGALTLNSGGTYWTFQSDAGKLIVNKALSSTAIGGRPILLQGAGDGEIKGAIQNGAGQVAIVKSGSGTWTLSGTNSYSQGTTINAGTLKVGNANCIPNGAGKGDLTVDGTLDLNANSITINGLSGVGMVDNGTGAASYLLTVGGNNRGGTFSGTIKNTSGTLGISKIGTGTITLSGANSYSGDTTISQGTLKLGASGVLPDGSGKGNLIVDAILDLGGNSETINGLSGSGTVDNTSGGTPIFSVGGNNVSSTFNGAFNSVTGLVSLIKIGSGTLTLGGSNAYTGNTTVSAGTLLVNGSINGSTLTVISLATLGGTGVINGPVTVLAGGILAPGASIGTFTINNSLALSGNTIMEINKTSAVLTSDRVTGVSTLTYGGTLTITATGSPLAENDTFDLFDATTFAGSFANINLPALPSCLVWDTSQLTVNGTIRVGPCPVQQLTVSGQIELQGFVGTTRTVTFVATGGSSNKTWNSSLTFTGTPRVASFSLVDAPPGTTGVSAKTLWNLRRKFSVTFSNGLALADFTTTNRFLRGGDIAGATTNAVPNNSINVTDFNKFRAHNGTTGAAAVPADITGNGSVNIQDYTILRGNLGRIGDAQ